MSNDAVCVNIESTAEFSQSPIEAVTFDVDSTKNTTGHFENVVPSRPKSDDQYNKDTKHNTGLKDAQSEKNVNPIV